MDLKNLDPPFAGLLKHVESHTHPACRFARNAFSREFSPSDGALGAHRPPRRSANSIMSAGVMPLIRLACAKLRGRTRSSFSRASARR